jgi:pyrroline-5-carboxylate reductase
VYKTRRTIKNKGKDIKVQKLRILMIGCGKMGGALLTPWLKQSEYSFTVVSPSGRELPQGLKQVKGPEELQGETFDLLILAVKPQVIASVLPLYHHLLGDDGYLLSIAAGFSAASIERVVGKVALVRVMPNLPVQIGNGVSALYANTRVTDAHRRSVTELMKATGKLVWVATEDDIDRVTAVAGSGPGYAFEIARCWVLAAQSLGFPPAESREMVLKTLAGSIELALNSEASLDELRDEVTSKNGTTAAGLSALNGDASLSELLQKTIEAAYARAVELR